MYNLLLEIYRGNFHLPERSSRSTKSGERAFSKMSRMEEALKQQLPEALKPLFEEFVQAQNDVLFTAEDVAFINGYQFGVQMIVAGMTEPLAD